MTGPARTGRRFARLPAALPACVLAIAIAGTGFDAWSDPVTAASGRVTLRASTHYYRSVELDVRPGIKTHVEPEYPAVAARRGLSGKVVLRLYINDKGTVDRGETLSAQPAGGFERSAEQAFRTARFTPGMKDKHPVKTQLTIEVSFDSPPPALPAGWR